MKEIMKCEKCGTRMNEINDETTIGMICPNCGYGYCTTNNNSIYFDETEYKISVVAFENEIESIKVLAKIMNKNYITIKNGLKKLPLLVYKGKAVDVNEKKKELDKSTVQYTISPKFPY